MSALDIKSSTNNNNDKNNDNKINKSNIIRIMIRKKSIGSAAAKPFSNIWSLKK